ncbi:hypothetical protein B0H13DRAFT_2016090 [Mycena leptocephala]|nr:hypothetical protein B0H13DRAFT_2016090 [Mycena leptocephala]
MSAPPLCAVPPYRPLPLSLIVSGLSYSLCSPTSPTSSVALPSSNPPNGYRLHAASICAVIVLTAPLSCRLRVHSCFPTIPFNVETTLARRRLVPPTSC